MRALFKDLDLSVLKTLMDINFWGSGIVVNMQCLHYCRQRERL